MSLLLRRDWKALAIACFVATAAIASAFASGQSAKSTLVVEGTQTSDVFGLGRSVVVRGTVAHGVLVVGGDLLVEGRIEGDAATIGGSIRQEDGSYIGGDVIVIGGTYQATKNALGRKPGSSTIMYAGYEEELRALSRNPASLLVPRWSFAYFGQRLLALLFWFIIALALSAAVPGAIGRAAANLKLNFSRVAVFGAVGAAVIAIGVPAALRFLPTTVGALVGITALLLIVASYVFGRVVVHLETGRWLQRLIFGSRKESASLAILLGTIFWTAMLTLPLVWPAVVSALLLASLGLALTIRRTGWRA
ncbi:MAG: hypothetical protein C4334_04820 [Pyrinomonas sp.]|uniref:hypothetical protein n=1 Tax=Pyrinomonas sp. TaxID=2080306 RepID=UPI0033323E67